MPIRSVTAKVKIRLQFQFGVAITLAFIALSIPTWVGAQDRVRAGYSGISGYQVPLWMGVDLGLFKKYASIWSPCFFAAARNRPLR
jgi:hypothetical protein